MLKEAFLFLLFFAAVLGQIQASTSSLKKVTPVQIHVLPKKHSDSESSEDTRRTEEIHDAENSTHSNGKIAPEPPSGYFMLYYRNGKSEKVSPEPKANFYQEAKHLVKELVKSGGIDNLIRNAHLSTVISLRSSISIQDKSDIPSLYAADKANIKKRLTRCISDCLENGEELFRKTNRYTELKSLCKGTCTNEEARFLEQIKSNVGTACIAHKLNQASQKNHTIVDTITNLFKK